eukprot:CAMPEP_0204261934 /NCGR_PEP_ID=MMETSP0468-20130131/7339_1 /ASSEMBLY_ACC=CAM_ASM_000383 /TAXON_ID=2969 /ORGANISM="Oxyrrhis marina" /LENGTH=50 /DNA_ID=CAMNT_0051236541 /DNA_START=190 /DNA_END=338 /DNA_ORIENTATION=-
MNSERPNGRAEKAVVAKNQQRSRVAYWLRHQANNLKASGSNPGRPRRTTT